MTNTDWENAAACIGDSWLFDHTIEHPGDSKVVAEAKAICNTCPSKGACLEAALTVEARTGYGTHGVRGGLDENERRALARRRRGTAACGTLGGHSAHRRDNTPVCEPCREAAATYQAAARLRRLSEKASA